MTRDPPPTRDVVDYEMTANVQHTVDVQATLGTHHALPLRLTSDTYEADGIMHVRALTVLFGTYHVQNLHAGSGRFLGPFPDRLWLLASLPCQGWAPAAPFPFDGPAFVGCPSGYPFVASNRCFAAGQARVPGLRPSGFIFRAPSLDFLRFPPDPDIAGDFIHESTPILLLIEIPRGFHPVIDPDFTRNREAAGDFIRESP